MFYETVKHLYKSLFCSRPATSLKERFQHRYLPLTFAKFLRNTFFTEDLPTTADVCYRFVKNLVKASAQQLNFQNQCQNLACQCHLYEHQRGIKSCLKVFIFERLCYNRFQHSNLKVFFLCLT